MVTRYDYPIQDDGEYNYPILETDDDGDFVTFEDYQKLEAKLAAAAERVAELEKTVKELQFSHTGEGTVMCTCNNYPHTPNCGLDERLVKSDETVNILLKQLAEADFEIARRWKA